MKRLEPCPGSVYTMLVRTHQRGSKFMVPTSPLGSVTQPRRWPEGRPSGGMYRRLHKRPPSGSGKQRSRVQVKDNRGGERVTPLGNGGGGCRQLASADRLAGDAEGAEVRARGLSLSGCIHVARD